MAIEDIFRALEEQADRECRDILDSAKAAAKSITAEAKAEAEAVRAERVAVADPAMRIKVGQIVNAAKLVKMKELAAARDRNMGAVYDAALAKLAAMRGTPQYATLFKKLAQEALAGVEAGAVVQVDPADEALAKASLAEMGVQALVDPSLSVAGGLNVVLSGGRIRRSNTLEDRLDKVRKTRHAEVAEILFG